MVHPLVPDVASVCLMPSAEYQSSSLSAACTLGGFYCMSPWTQWHNSGSRAGIPTVLQPNYAPMTNLVVK